MTLITMPKVTLSTTTFINVRATHGLDYISRDSLSFPFGVDTRFYSKRAYDEWYQYLLNNCKSDLWEEDCYNKRIIWFKTEEHRTMMVAACS
jgi:hypothetical protein